MDHDQIRNALETISENSEKFSGWCLLAIGASLLAVLSTEYVRPITGKAQLIYLIFIPAWALFAFSLKHGNDVLGYHAGSFLVKESLLKDMLVDANNSFSDQLTYMHWSFSTLSIWLVSYLVLWIFSSKDV